MLMLVRYPQISTYFQGPCFMITSTDSTDTFTENRSHKPALTMPCPMDMTF